jgi:hypothetical protein
VRHRAVLTIRPLIKLRLKLIRKLPSSLRSRRGRGQLFTRMFEQTAPMCQCIWMNGFSAVALRALKG